MTIEERLKSYELYNIVSDDTVNYETIYCL